MKIVAKKNRLLEDIHTTRVPLPEDTDIFPGLPKSPTGVVRDKVVKRAEVKLLNAGIPTDIWYQTKQEREESEEWLETTQASITDEVGSRGVMPLALLVSVSRPGLNHLYAAKVLSKKLVIGTSVPISYAPLHELYRLQESRAQEGNKLAQDEHYWFMRRAREGFAVVSAPIRFAPKKGAETATGVYELALSGLDMVLVGATDGREAMIESFDLTEAQRSALSRTHDVRYIQIK